MELTAESLEGFFAFMSPLLDERQRRLMAGAMAEALGRGGRARVVEASHMSSRTVLDGVKQVRGVRVPVIGCLALVVGGRC